MTAAAVTALNLREVTRYAIEHAASLEYDDIAKDVLTAISPDDYLAALQQVLPRFVADVARGMRASGPAETPDDPPASWKVAAIKARFERRLAEIYPTQSGNKRLADFTYADLMYQAGLLRDQARKNLARAKGWEALAKALTAAEVRHVRDLDDQTLEAKLEGVE